MERPEPYKLLQPRSHKAKVCIWGDLTVSDLEAIYEARSSNDIKAILASVFGLQISDTPDLLKDSILLDLFYYTIQFGIDNGFTKEQTSALFSMVKRTHDICTETPFGNVNECFAFFKDMLLCHSVKRPPFSIDLFKPDHVKLITEYVISTYFRHFKMYKYVFTPLVKLDLSLAYEGVPEPPQPQSSETEEESKEGPKTPEATDIVEVEKTDFEKPISIEMTPAQQELHALIRRQLEEEVQRLRLNVEDQLRATDDALNQKLANLESSNAAGGAAGGKSAKKKK